MNGATTIGCQTNQLNMTYNPKIHDRKSIRLKGYDYSREGLYFLTICTQNRACLFGEIVGGKMILNDAGNMVVNEWAQLPHRFTNIRLHEYVTMPNHFHAILEIVGATLVVAPERSPGGHTGAAGVQGAEPPQPKRYAPAHYLHAQAV